MYKLTNLIKNLAATSCIAVAVILGGVSSRADTPPTERVETPTRQLKRVNFALDATTDNPYSLSVNTATKKEYNAFLSIGWKTNPGDNPGDPLHPYWMGRATYHVTANNGDPDYSPILAPQNFQWYFDGDGTLNPVPGDAQGAELYQKDISLSYDTKALVHDLGPAVMPPEFVDDAAGQAASEQQLQEFLAAAKQFPKTTTVRAWVHKDGDPNGPLLKSEVKIHWYLPYTQIYEISASIHINLPNGEQLDPTELPSTAGFFDDMADDVNEQQIQFFSKHRLTPAMVASAAEESVGALGNIAVETTAIVLTEGAGEAIAGFVRVLADGTVVAEGTVGAVETAVAVEAPTAEPVVELAAKETKFFPKVGEFFRKLNFVRAAKAEEPVSGVAKIIVKRRGFFGSVNKLRVAAGASLVGVGAVNWQMFWQAANPGTGTVPVRPTSPQPGEFNPLESGPDEDEREERVHPGRFYYSRTNNDVVIQPDNPGQITNDPASQKGLVIDCRNQYVKPVRDDRTFPGYVLPVGPSDIFPAGYWQNGYYLTFVSPDTLGNPFLNLSSGEFSFSQFAQPYSFGSGPIYWYYFDWDPAQQDAPDQRIGATFGTRLRGSRYYINTLIGLHLNGCGTVTFANSRLPGKEDVAPGERFPSMTDNGTWYMPGSNAPATIPTGKNPTTGRDWRADMDWAPSDPKTLAIIGNDKIEFRRGYPNFTPYLAKDSELPNGFQVDLGIQHGDLELDDTQMPPDLQQGEQENSGYDFSVSDATLGKYLYDVNSEKYPFVQNGQTILSRVRNWRRQYRVANPNNPGSTVSRPLTWHHYEDMRTMQLVPGAGLNNIISHDGGGKWARIARW